MALGLTSSHAGRAALGGLAALALAMGIGRFAYTPVLPIMQEDAGLGAAAAGYIASANFAGYLAGALLAALGTGRFTRSAWLRAGLVASVATTALMAAGTGAVAWAGLRFLGGVASAVVMVYVSSLVLEVAVRAGWGAAASLLYGGVGTGIALSALAVGWAAHRGLRSSGTWAVLALLGVPLLALAWLWVVEPQAREAGGGAAVQERPARAPAGALGWLTAGYGCFGFGYVITATFLVVMVRRLPVAPAHEALVWLVVGLTAAPSIWVWGRAADRIGIGPALVAAYLLEAAGVVLTALAPGVGGVLAGTALLGGTFVAITAMGLSAGRALAPARASRVIARLTAAFGVGQIVGPAVAGWLAERSGGFVIPSLAAAAVLLSGAAMVALSGRETTVSPLD